MTLHRTAPSRRTGIIAVLTAVLIVFFIGMVAFSVDTTWIVLSQTELQSAADAAALAGVEALMNGYMLYSLPGQSDDAKSAALASAKDSARAKAKEFAARNMAGGVSNLILQDADIEFGFLDDKDNYTAKPSGFPNTVTVTMRRDSSANGELKLFFAAVLGTTSTRLQATASATMYAGTLAGFTANPGVRSTLLPVTYDESHWDNFVATGKGPDGDALGDASGNPELKVYPSIKYKGNFGLLSLDDAHAGASDLSEWIHVGMSDTDIQALQAGNLIPLASHDANLWDWRGDNGFKSSNVQDINQYMGEVRILPLYKAKNPAPDSYEAGVGQGGWYDYNVTRLVGVRIMYTADPNREILVQPAAVVDPNAVFTPGSVAPVGSTAASSSLSMIFAAPKLTR